MKRIFIISVLFIFTCSYGQEITKEYYVNGNLSGEGQVIDGSREGSWKLYYDTGEILAEVNFIEGVMNGEIVKYHKNGQIKSEGRMIYGSNEGEAVAYYENGNLYQKINFKNNKWHGDYQFYYNNGNLMELGTFFEGKKKGIVKLYDIDGKLKSQKLYDGSEKTPQEIFIERLRSDTQSILGESYTEYKNDIEKDEKGSLVKFFDSLIKFARWSYMNPFYSGSIMILIVIIFNFIKSFKP